MIKNGNIYEAFIRQEKLQKKKKPSKEWHKKADELYGAASKINSNSIHRQSNAHLKMLVKVRKKIKKISRQRA